MAFAPEPSTTSTLLAKCHLRSSKLGRCSRVNRSEGSRHYSVQGHTCCRGYCTPYERRRVVVQTADPFTNIGPQMTIAYRIVAASYRCNGRLDALNWCDSQRTIALLTWDQFSEHAVLSTFRLQRDLSAAPCSAGQAGSRGINFFLVIDA